MHDSTDNVMASTFLVAVLYSKNKKYVKLMMTNTIIKATYSDLRMACQVFITAPYYPA